MDSILEGITCCLTVSVDFHHSYWEHLDKGTWAISADISHIWAQLFKASLATHIFYGKKKILFCVESHDTDFNLFFTNDAIALNNWVQISSRMHYVSTDSDH